MAQKFPYSHRTIDKYSLWAQDSKFHLFRLTQAKWEENESMVWEHDCKVHISSEK